MTLKPFIYLFRKVLFLSNILLFFFLASCSDTTDNITVEKKDKYNMITRFFFSEDENPSLSKYVPGNINQSSNEIHLQLPSGGDITSLIPNISLSGIATISPEINSPIDFSVPVEFVVKSEMGNTNTYKVFVSLSSENKITEFYFKRSENQGLEQDLYGEIDEINKRILFDLPLAAEIKNLNATIVLDANSVTSLGDFPKDFSNIKQYEVIADNGEASIYSVSVSYDRHVLIEFGRVNDLFSRFRWSLNTNHNTWKNIEVNEYNRVTSLSASCSCVEFFLSEIDLLTELKGLGLSATQTNTSTTLPFDIGKLTKLEGLSINNSRIEQFPSGIGKLTKLQAISLSDNNLKSLPIEMGNLSELYNLRIKRNQITSLPSEMGNLKKLKSISANENLIEEIPSSFGGLSQLENFSLTYNKIASIPAELGDLENIINIDLYFNRLLSIPKELGQLQTLISLSIGRNGITAIPKELSQIKTLQVLSAGQNSFTSIPKEICDMRDLYGTIINVDDHVICEE